jgi:branched-chain amino acid transport system substrate-binding protein
MKQATSLAPFEVPTLLPGITVSTTPRIYRPVRQMQLQRWDGRSWLRFGRVIEGADV